MPGRHSYQSLVLEPSGTGDVSVIAAPTLSHSIYVVAFGMVASAASVVRFKSGTGTNLTGAFSFAVNGGISLSAPADGWLFKTNPGDALIVNQTVDGVDGLVTYFIA